MRCMYDNVLVVARGDVEEPALGRALRSLPTNASLTLLDVVHEPTLDGYLGHRELYEPLRARLVAERQERLDVLRDGIGADRVAACKAVWGHPSDEAIEAEAALAGAELVVTAPADDGGLTSSDWRLVARCRVPVLMVRSRGDAEYRAIVAALDPFHAHARQTDLDAAILRHAKALQAASGAALTALHCQPPLPAPGAVLGVAADPKLEAEDRALRLAALEELLTANGVPASAAKIETGAPHTVLRGLAERGAADLLVMGVLARGRLHELIVGHTAERVLQAGAADVLVVK